MIYSAIEIGVGRSANRKMPFEYIILNIKTLAELGLDDATKKSLRLVVGRGIARLDY